MLQELGVLSAQSADLRFEFFDTGLRDYDSFALTLLADRLAAAIDLATEDNIKNAAQIRDFIVARGWARVDIVAQSMGGVAGATGPAGSDPRSGPSRR